MPTARRPSLTLAPAGGDAGRLARVLEEAPFHAGSNLFIIAGKGGGGPGGGSSRLRVTGLLPTRGAHWAVQGRSWQIRIAVPRGGPGRAVVCGSAVALSAAGSAAVSIESGSCAKVQANSRASFELEAGEELLVRGQGSAEIFLHDVVLTESL